MGNKKCGCKSKGKVKRMGLDLGVGGDFDLYNPDVDDNCDCGCDCDEGYDECYEEKITLD